MCRRLLFLGALLVPACLCAQVSLNPKAEEKPAPSWTLTATGGWTNTFQLILGGTFGTGTDVQDKLTGSVNNAFLSGDAVSYFGWSTTDFPSATPNYQTGLLYKAPIVRRKRQGFTVTVGGQRWILPLVKQGTKDWFFTGNATYNALIKRVPVFVSEDSYSLLKSNLPTGSALYSQIYTQHVVWKGHGLELGLKQGPAYTYSWGLYGANGSRVVRYGGAMVTRWKGMTLESGYRRQFGLQDKIPDNGYWSVLLTRSMSGHFRRF
jgi:hypothetical protein